MIPLHIKASRYIGASHKGKLFEHIKRKIKMETHQADEVRSNGDNATCSVGRSHHSQCPHVFTGIGKRAKLQSFSAAEKTLNTRTKLLNSEKGHGQRMGIYGRVYFDYPFQVLLPAAAFSFVDWKCPSQILTCLSFSQFFRINFIGKSWM